MQVGVLGSGPVATTLAAGFVAHGHDVTMGTRHPAKLADWAADHGGVPVGSFAEAAAYGEVVVLAVGGRIAGEVLGSPAHGRPVVRRRSADDVHLR